MNVTECNDQTCEVSGQHWHGDVETSDPLRAAADLLAWNLDKLRAAEEAAGTFPSPAFWEWNSVGYAIQAALDEREPKS